MLSRLSRLNIVIIRTFSHLLRSTVAILLFRVIVMPVFAFSDS